MLKKLSRARKTITALVVGNLGWVAIVVASEPARITASEWLAFGIANATALGVYTVANAR